MPIDYRCFLEMFLYSNYKYKWIRFNKMKILTIFIVIILSFTLGCVISDKQEVIKDSELVKDIGKTPNKQEVINDPELIKDIVKAYEQTDSKLKDYAENVYEIEGLEECFNKISLDTKCFANYAIENNNVSLCYEMKHTKWRDQILDSEGAYIMNCISMYALEVKDEKACELIKAFTSLTNSKNKYDECIQIINTEEIDEDVLPPYIGSLKNQELMWYSDNFVINDYNTNLDLNNRPYFVLFLDNGEERRLTTNMQPHYIITFGTEHEHPYAGCGSCTTTSEKCMEYDYSFAYTIKYSNSDLTNHVICCPLNLDFCKNIYLGVAMEEGRKNYDLKFGE
jgi:hypothetical protein